MGRSRFEELVLEMEKPGFMKTWMAIYLYGSSGSGKSHILAALAFKLAREGKRILYFPDCSTLVKEFELCLRGALSFAFYDSDLLEEILSARNEEELVRFWQNQRGHYILVDQLNALENCDNGPQIRRRLDGMAYRHHYIFSASANEKSCKDANMKQSSITTIPYHGGINEVFHDSVILPSELIVTRMR